MKKPVVDPGMEILYCLYDEKGDLIECDHMGRPIYPDENTQLSHIEVKLCMNGGSWCRLVTSSAWTSFRLALERLYRRTEEFADPAQGYKEGISCRKGSGVPDLHQAEDGKSKSWICSVLNCIYRRSV